MNAADEQPTESQPIEPQPTELNPPDTTRQLLRRVLRRAFFAFLLAMTLTLVVAHWCPLKYTGTTTFTLRSDSAAGSARSRGNESLEQAKLTLKHDLLDRRAFEAVIAELGLDRGLPRNQSNVELTREGQKAKQKLVESLQSGASLVWEVRSSNVDLLSLSFTDANAKMAAEIPNALVKNYIERTSHRITDQLTASRDFLKKQVEACETRLRNLDTERISFEKQHATAMPESFGAAQSKIDGLKADMRRLSRERIKVRNKLDEAKGKIGQLNRIFPNAINELKKDWPKNTRDEVDTILGLKLAVNATPHPASQLASRTTQDPPAGPASDPLGLYAMSVAMAECRMASQEWELLQSEYHDLEKKYNDMSKLMANFHVVRRRYEELWNKMAKEQNELNAWQTRLNDIQMALEAEIANRRTHMTTVQAAQVKFLPEAPQLLRIMAAALCVALLAIHWAISPLVTLGQRTIAVVWVSLVSLAVLMMTVYSLAVLGLSACVVVSAWLAVVLDRWWSRSRAGALVVVLFAIVIVCAAIAAMNNITLKLQYPEMFVEWKAAPFTFLYEHWIRPVVEWVSNLLNEM